MFLKINPHFITPQKLIRKKFKKNEIFFSTYYIVKQTKFTPNLLYFSYKSRINNFYYTLLKNRCIITNNSRSVYTKLKISKKPLSYKLSVANMAGFYRSVW